MYCHYEKAIEDICREDYMYFFSMENVVGMAKGLKKMDGGARELMVLKVLVTKKVPIKDLPKKDRIPKMYKGVQTDVEAVGVMEALEIPPLNGRERPVEGGYSVGEINITAGTIGCIVFDGNGINTTAYILSNNHVLANQNRAPIGSPIVQPGPADGGRAPQDTIGFLSDFIPIQFVARDRMPENLVDAAIAETTDAAASREIYNIGFVDSVNRDFAIGDRVYKTGRTTAYTTGLITMTNATVMVRYDQGQAMFMNQIITEPMSSPGDSGSLLVDGDNRVVGLLFAGSAAVTLYNPFFTVMEMFNFRLK